MMDESNILEAGAPERKLRLHTIMEIFCLLLFVVLLSDPTFTCSAENFFDLLLVPIAKTGNANAVYEKSSGNMPDMQTTTKNVLKELDLKDPIIPYPDESCLLAEVVTTGQSVMLKDSFNPYNNSTKDAPNFPVLAMTDESIVKDTLPTNPSNEWMESNDNTVDFNPQPNPLPEPALSEITASDSKLQDFAISERPSDVNTQINIEHPTDLEVQPDFKLPSDMQDASEIIESDIIQDSAQTSADTSKIQESIVQEPLPGEPQIPSETITSPVISEETPNSSTSERIEPDSEIPDSTESADMETGTGDDTTMETTSCFLIDEAGMLYGFLPEYAQMQDGYLILPEECTGIRSGAFSGTGAQIAELYIPAGITIIEDGAFTGLDSLTYIDVDGSNPVYTTINGVLFDSTATVLLAFPAGRIGSYLLPAQVTQIASGAFMNTSLSHLDCRRCPSLFLSENIFGPSFENGVVIDLPAESLPVY